VAENSSVWRSLRALARHGDNVFEEAHVEHAVGLVEHQGGQRVELEAFPRQMVHHAPRRADDDVRAMLQRGELPAQRHAATQGDDLDVVVGPGQPADLRGHLIGQLACRAQHQRLHGKTARVQAGQQSERKRRRLAAAGFGLGDDVLAEQGGGQAGGLDRGHGEVAELLQVGQHGGRERQAGEVGRGRGWRSGGHP
jgi:hypothetical protein